jgi:hypothetical protein
VDNPLTFTVCEKVTSRSFLLGLHCHILLSQGSVYLSRTKRILLFLGLSGHPSADASCCPTAGSQQGGEEGREENDSKWLGKLEAIWPKISHKVAAKLPLCFGF